MSRPDYQGGGIVNLMSTLTLALGGPAPDLPALGVLPPERLAGVRNLVLLVVDGLGWHYLTQRARGSELERRLLAPLRSVVPPTTAAAIPTFLTGAPPCRHGFTGWFMWLKELGCVTAVLPFVSRHGGLPLGDGGIGPLALGGAPPLFDRLPVASHVLAPERIAGSVFNRAYSGRAQVHGYRDLEGFFDLLRRLVRGAGGERRYVYAYWSELDALAHEHGIGSVPVLRHFAQWDAAFGRLLRAAAGSDTVFLVTADHGFVDVPPERQVQLADHPDLQSCLLLPLCGEPRFAYCYVHPAACRRFEDYVTDVLAHQAWLIPSEVLLDQGLLGPGPAHPRLAERVGHYVLAMREGYSIKDRMPGEREWRHLGMHGGLSAAELTVPLVVAPV